MNKTAEFIFNLALDESAFVFEDEKNNEQNQILTLLEKQANLSAKIENNILTMLYEVENANKTNGFHSRMKASLKNIHRAVLDISVIYSEILSLQETGIKISRKRDGTHSSLKENAIENLFDFSKAIEGWILCGAKIDDETKKQLLRTFKFLLDQVPLSKKNKARQKAMGRFKNKKIFNELELIENDLFC